MPRLVTRGQVMGQGTRWLGAGTCLVLVAGMAATSGCHACPAGEYRCVGNTIEACPRLWSDTDPADLRWHLQEDCGPQACALVKDCGPRCTENNANSYAFCAPEAQSSPRCPPDEEAFVCDGADLLQCRFGHLMASTACATADHCRPSVSSQCLERVEAGSFVPTGTLTEARESHTATLLPSGQVLIVGGQSTSGVLSLVEVYDPATDDFAPAAGDLATERQLHTATTLLSGQVVVAGGTARVDALDSAELFQ